jgi:hypothetical protein
MGLKLKGIALRIDASLARLYPVMKDSRKKVRWNSIQNGSNAGRKCPVDRKFPFLQFPFDMAQQKSHLALDPDYQMETLIT